MAAQLTVVHRQAQLAIRARVLRDLVRIWPAMDWTDLDRTFPAWAAAVGPLVDRYRATSTNLAAAYLRTFRASQGVPGAPSIVLAGPVPAEQLAVSLATTANWGIRAAAARGVGAEQAMADAFVRSSGAATRLVLQGGRDTITESIKADQRAVGFMRVADGAACAFCQQLVDWSEGNPALQSDFEAHDHCGCTAEPVYA